MKNIDWFNLIEALAKVKKISEDKILDNLSFAIEKAYLREYPDLDIKININKDEKEISLIEIRSVVNDYPEIDDDREITIEDAILIDKKINVGDFLENIINISDFDRRIAQHVRQVFEQKMSEVSNSLIFDAWEDKIGTIIKAEVEEVKDKYIEINLGHETKGVVLKSDQIRNDKLELGKKYFFYIRTIKESTKGWPIILSRSHSGLVENLLSEFIEEIKNGIIEIKAIARIAGFKTKIAVESHQEGIDPIGTCVGVGGERIKSISKEINDEFIDFVKWDDDLKQLIVNSCVPHKIIGLEINNDEDHPDGDHKLISVVLENSDIPKFIGRDGANIKLISKITNCTIEGIFSLEDAIENDIKYDDVSHLNPRSHSKSFIKHFPQDSLTDEDFNFSTPNHRSNNVGSSNNFSKPRTFSKPKKQVTSFDEYYKEEYEVKTFDHHLDDDAFDDIIENISVPKREKISQSVVNENIDDILFEDGDAEKDLKSKYKKSRAPKITKKEESIFKEEMDEFDDITEDSLEQETNVDFSDNLEIDEDE